MLFLTLYKHTRLFTCNNEVCALELFVVVVVKINVFVNSPKNLLFKIPEKTDDDDDAYIRFRCMFV